MGKHKPKYKGLSLKEAADLLRDKIMSGASNEEIEEITGYMTEMQMEKVGERVERAKVRVWEKYRKGKKERERYSELERRRTSKEIGGLVRSVERKQKELGERHKILEETYEALNPSLFRRVLDYIIGVHPKRAQKPRHYLVLFGIIFIGLVYLIFKNKSSIIGYSIIETVINANYVVYFLLFILVLVVLFYVKER